MGRRTVTYPTRIGDYPFPIVRLTCRLCPHRRGLYRLERLVQRFGADADLDSVRRFLARPCRRLEIKGKALNPGCLVDYPDLHGRD